MISRLETPYKDKHIILVNECKKGKRKAQFELYKLYAKAMYSVAFRILNDEAEAQDVLQEAFLEAFSKIQTFREETTFGLWLKRIVINRSINQRSKFSAELVSLEGIDVSEEYEEKEDLELKLTEIRHAMTKLPEGYRIVLSLYLFEGYDHEEIGYILKVSENTSRSQYMRAKMKLNDLIEKERSIR